MPSKSPAQARLMAAAANNPKFAKKAGVPQKVAREFHEADESPSYEASQHSKKFLTAALRNKASKGY